MSTQQQTIQKGQRRPAKKPHHAGQHSRSVVSDNDAANVMHEYSAGSGEGKVRSRKKSQAVKKGHGQNDAAAYSDSSTPRPASHHLKTHATPVKQQAYAGPTFHQSPAASALPLPSFYSKSMPTASPLKAGADGTQSPEQSTKELSRAEMPALPTEVKRETTPLDFLFDAARKASVTPGTESPNHKHYFSSAADSPMSRSPAVREGDTDFPFELDTGERVTWNNGSAMSTPFKDRIEAAKRTSSVGGKSLNENERKEKTAALKEYLISGAPAQDGDFENNPFNARPATSPYSQYQYRSSPSTPYSAPVQGTPQQYFPPMPNVMHYQSPNRHGPSSNLRNVYQPAPDVTTPVKRSNDGAKETRISTAREQPAKINFSDIYNTAVKPNNQGATHRATPSAQQLEDDLRKILKLDLVSRG